MREELNNWRNATHDPFLDPAFGEAYGAHVMQQKIDWEIQHGLRKAPPKKKASKVGKKINLSADFTKGMPQGWESPNGHPGKAGKGGITADFSENGMSMAVEFDDEGIGAGTAEVSAIFVQSPEATAHAVNWGIGLSSATGKYIQNQDADTVCVRFISAGGKKGRLWWSVYNGGKQVGQSWSANVSTAWKPGDEIQLRLSYDLDTGRATAKAVNLATGQTLAEDSIAHPGIGGFQYAGFEMTRFPKNRSGAPGAVRRFSFSASK